MLWLEVIFWSSLTIIIFVTIVYPVMVYGLSSFIRKQEVLWDGEPTVSLIIAAYNEEKEIKRKLENSLKLDYPKEKLEIIVASDGSTDRTNEIVATFCDKGIKLYKYDRMGKTGIQNETVKKARGEILVFSDANGMYKEDAIKKLIRNFGNDKIGCVCGQLIYESEDINIAGVSEGSYWNYEKQLKTAESKLSSLIGANGSIYALRKNDYTELDNSLISDLVEPLEIVKKGKKVKYEPEAISIEKSSGSMNMEFARKVRIITRSIKGILHMRSLFNPFKFGIFSVQLFLHKMSRYTIPVFLMLCLLSLILLTHEMLYFIIFVLLIVLLVFAVIAKFTENTVNNNKYFGLVYYYLIVHYAIILAWGNVFRKEEMTIWTTDRK